jgi:hypothetical protein
MPYRQAQGSLVGGAGGAMRLPLDNADEAIYNERERSFHEHPFRCLGGWATVSKKGCSALKNLGR